MNWNAGPADSSGPTEGWPWWSRSSPSPPSLTGSAREQSAELVQAQRIQLVDDEGRVRMDLRHDSTETGLFVIDAAGDTRWGAARFAHGGGGYAVYGPGGRGAAVLYLSGDGSLTIYDADGEVTARFPEGR